LNARNDPREVIADSHARYFGTELNERSLFPGDEPELGESRFDEWLGRTADFRSGIVRTQSEPPHGSSVRRSRSQRGCGGRRHIVEPASSMLIDCATGMVRLRDGHRGCAAINGAEPVRGIDARACK